LPNGLVSQRIFIDFLPNKDLANRELSVSLRNLYLNKALKSATPMMYTTLPLFIAEVINVFAAIATYWLLAKKHQSGWLFYFLSSIALIYIFWTKGAWITVLNQSMMGVLAIKNYFLFHRPTHSLHRHFEKLTIGVFLISLAFFQGFSWKNISELILWMLIIGKTVLLGKQHIWGWHFQIIQQLVSIIFGWYQQIYLYTFKSVLFTIQGVYGYWKWNNTAK